MTTRVVGIAYLSKDDGTWIDAVKGFYMYVGLQCLVSTAEINKSASGIVDRQLCLSNILRPETGQSRCIVTGEPCISMLHELIVTKQKGR